MPTRRERLRAATEQLTRAGVPSPEVDARALLLHALNVSPTALVTGGDLPVTPAEEATLSALLARRAAREPLQYLLGPLEWGGVLLAADPRALVPRPETEWLLHLSLRALAGVTAPRVLDVGTGTGALALGIRAARPDARVTATDVSEGTLTLARENARRNGLDVTILHADLLDGVPGVFDVIVSNPPYLPDADRTGASPEVEHDPTLALYSGPDGLDIARRLAAGATAALVPGGRLLLELDPRNVRTLAHDLDTAGWAVTVHADLTGRERFVDATRP
ncbi:release factor glutamine methyltransferase [Deinococcus metalli]|uniref:Release factor glutamine methyltransferase n=1 Tax=Deinococcus metalli TaxID=1141878 RepID=A0A7W8KD99_9DEIO|nr:peptide chain release factor N(5)-glutamine methyltransferase [Deinococcus metalli]MBB5376090.1 release factor glutamine methyltransferase [Deinococcus metalli]GHF40874.1 release factor glutamine methyltransferase [Deinococcus metalli]